MPFLRILISNDDWGIFAEGIPGRWPPSRFEGHQVTVVAPDQETSATHGLTMQAPLALRRRSGRCPVAPWGDGLACSGNPFRFASSLALWPAAGETPELVLVPGITMAPQTLGTDVF